MSPVLGDLIILAFFYLLRPGEYTLSPAPESAPFRIRDVHLFQGGRKLDVFTASDDDLLPATYCGLEFTTQKNCVKGEVIGLGLSSKPDWCPVRATVRLVVRLRRANAPPHTPLHAYLHHGRWCGVTSANITAHLRIAVAAIGAGYGLHPADICARALRCSGAMALLCADVDTDLIRLVGRWRSDEMFRYLHTYTSCPRYFQPIRPYGPSW